MKLPRYKRFNNNILRITDAFIFDEDDDERIPFQQIYQYLSFENCDQCFYFAASYLKALVQWDLYNENFDIDYNDQSGHCKNIVKHLKKAKNQIKILILINIEPTLKSVLGISKITGNKYFKKIEDYRQTEFYKQFETRKKILNNLIEHIDKNIKVTEEYIKDYLPNNSNNNLIKLCKENVSMKKCLHLEESETKDLEYLYDAGFEVAYELKLKKTIWRKNLKYYLIWLGYFVSFIISFLPLGIALSEYIDLKLEENMTKELVDINEEYSLFASIKNMVSSIFSGRENNQNNPQAPEGNRNRNEIINDNNDNNNNNNSTDKKLPENISKLRFIELKEKTLKIMKEKIVKIFNEKIKDIKEEVKFLVFVDNLFKEKTWNGIIREITSKSFDTREMILKKGEIIKLFNKESQYENAIEKLSSEIEKALNNISAEIKYEFYKEGYEKNKEKRLEQIIIRKRFWDIDYETAIKIVQRILYQNILDKDGKFNKDLFIKKEDKKDKAKETNEEKEKEIFIQYVKIFYDTPMVKKFKKIKNIDDFTLKNNFKLNFEHDLILQDVQMLYLTKNYRDFDKRLFKDFTNGIKDIIKEIYKLSIEDITDKFDSFIKTICQIIYEKVKTYLELEILPNILLAKSKIKKKKLNEEEQRVVNLINESSRQKAFDFMKYKNFGQLMD